MTQPLRLWAVAFSAALLAVPSADAQAPAAVPVPQAAVPAEPAVPAPPDPTSPHRVVSAPKLSPSRMRKVIGETAIEILLTRDYQEASDSEGEWKSRVLADAVVARFFQKTEQGARRTLEIAAVPGVVSGFEIHIHGRLRPDAPGAPAVPNPDLAEVEATVRRLAEAASRAPQKIAPEGAAAAPMPGSVPGMAGFGMPGIPGMPSAPSAPSDRPALNTPEDLGHTIYDLSYAQADRAIAMLKALGYSTVEFSQTTGDSQYERVYVPSVTTGRDLPLVVKMIDAPKTSLMDSPPPAPVSSLPGTMGMPMQTTAGFPGLGSPASKAVPDIGGTYLHQQTAGEPQQRLLILYDRSDPAPMEHLIGVLHDEIDVPARQVVISALVLEVNTNRARELGVQFQGAKGQNAFAFQLDSLGNPLPFTFTFDKDADKAFAFNATLTALVQKGEAEILSNPSVLVLDGRQARIQVGQQVPVVNSTSTAAGITSSVEYFPVGIVLNLRPRISDDGGEVTMQVETIVSAVSGTTTTSASVFYAPTVDNRQVQTFVRVGDNTPFIIGGLISTQSSKNRSGLPFLSDIPLLGALFRHGTSSATKREVIVVLTPHVVPKEDPSFSYVIPKDSQRFDSFGHLLFRNAYRIRSSDLFDLDFIHESRILSDVVGKLRLRAEVDPSLRHTPPYAGLLQGQAPGEEILVKRMLWEVVRRSGYAQKIDPKQILVFRPSAADPTSTDFELSFLDGALAKLTPQQNALILRFDGVKAGTPEHPFAQPKAELRYESVTKDTYTPRLVELNKRKPDGTPDMWTIILSDAYAGTSRPLDTLRGVLVLKRLLALNSTLPLTVKNFSVGRQVTFPTQDDIEKAVHVVDDQTARLFYEVTEYYRAFEEEFNRVTREAQAQLKPR